MRRTHREHVEGSVEGCPELQVLRFSVFDDDVDFVVVADFAVTMDLPLRVLPDREFRSEITRICGVDTYEVLSAG